MSPAPVLSTTFTFGTSTWEILFPSSTRAGSLPLVTTAFRTFFESLTSAAFPSLVPVSAFASSRSIFRASTLPRTFSSFQLSMSTLPERVEHPYEPLRVEEAKVRPLPHLLEDLGRDLVRQGADEGRVELLVRDLVDGEGPRTSQRGIATSRRPC